jgi:hypothetical protein
VETRETSRAFSLKVAFQRPTEGKSITAAQQFP